MASTIAALTAGGGGVATTADSSGNLDLKSGTTTVLALTATGVAVTGTLTSSLSYWWYERQDSAHHSLSRL